MDLSCTLASGSTVPMACISMGIVRTSAAATSTGTGGASGAFCEAGLWQADMAITAARIAGIEEIFIGD